MNEQEAMLSVVDTVEDAVNALDDAKAGAAEMKAVFEDPALMRERKRAERALADLATAQAALAEAAAGRARAERALGEARAELRAIDQRKVDGAAEIADRDNTIRQLRAHVEEAWAEAAKARADVAALWVRIKASGDRPAAVAEERAAKERALVLANSLTARIDGWREAVRKAEARANAAEAALERHARAARAARTEVQPPAPIPAGPTAGIAPPEPGTIGYLEAGPVSPEEIAVAEDAKAALVAEAASHMRAEAVAAAAKEVQP